jgi:uncharacterized repeat protein (TIGR01451 family)
MDTLRLNHLPRALALLALVSVAPLTGFAQDNDGPSVATVTGSGPLETAIEVQRLEVREGRHGEEVRRWVPATRLNAGDEVHYTVRVRNPGKVAVESIVVTKRLPFGVRYLRGSAAGPAAEVQYSLDGGKTFATAEQLAKAAGGGKQGARKSLENDYTHVRWVLSRPLGPSSTALLRFRAIFS